MPGLPSFPHQSFVSLSFSIRLLCTQHTSSRCYSYDSTAVKRQTRNRSCATIPIGAPPRILRGTPYLTVGSAEPRPRQTEQVCHERRAAKSASNVGDRCSNNQHRAGIKRRKGKPKFQLAEQQERICAFLEHKYTANGEAHSLGLRVLARRVCGALSGTQQVRHPGCSPGWAGRVAGTIYFAVLM